MQALALAALYVPGLQAAQELEPATLYRPAPQAVHAREPSDMLNLPAGQEEQAPLTTYCPA